VVCDVADPDRIDVAYHGADQSVFHLPSPEELRHARARLGIGDLPYVAFLGAKEPRKNVPSLIRGWAMAVRDRERPPALVVAGGQGHDDEIDEAVAEVPSHLRLLRPGFLRYTDLAGFLGGALMACYPSRGEGFGLPVLEAMACGTPVVTSNTSSLPEVAGDAALLVDPYDVEEIATAMRRILEDEALAAELRAKGLARAKEFSWERTARETIAVYEKVLGKKLL